MPEAPQNAAATTAPVSAPETPGAAGSIEKAWRNETGQLVVQLPGRAEPVADAVVARCFPRSLPGRYVSVRDRQGKELALLKNLDALDAPTRQLLEQELRDKVFVPQILKVVSHRREFGLTSMTLETDRGRVSLQIGTRDDIRFLTTSRVLLRDADGNTYEVPDTRALDPESQGYLSEYF